MIPCVLLLMVINAAAMVAYGLDKMAARARMRRIREADLLILALLGGWAGSLLGMLVFRHKTRDRAFLAGLLVATIMNILLLVILLWLRMRAADGVILF